MDKDSIDKTCFIFYESLKRFSRKDNLIGLYLTLDLIREYLVLEMIDRDIDIGTNIHHFVISESLTKVLNLELLQTSKTIDKLKLLQVLTVLIC